MNTKMSTKYQHILFYLAFRTQTHSLKELRHVIFITYFLQC